MAVEIVEIQRHARTLAHSPKGYLSLPAQFIKECRDLLMPGVEYNKSLGFDEHLFRRDGSNLSLNASRLAIAGDPLRNPGSDELADSRDGPAAGTVAVLAQQVGSQAQVIRDFDLVSEQGQLFKR